MNAVRTGPEATVTVCVPVWNGASFVADTLASIRRQTHADIRVLVSVDASDDGSLAICQRLAEGDRRLRVVGQPERLGWIGNVNWLLRHVETSYACILPHDDLVCPDYVESLLGALTNATGAALAFSDVETFGSSRSLLTGTELRGAVFERLLRFLAENHDAIAWRGLWRTDVARRAGPLQPDDPAADIGWLLRLAMLGELVRVPRTLYRKRLHASSVTAIAQSMGGGALAREWTTHCVACRRAALAAGEWTAAQRRALAIASQMRLLASPVRSTFELFDSTTTYAEALAATSDISGQSEPPAVLSPDVERYLRRRARALLARYALRRTVRSPAIRRVLRRLLAAWRRTPDVTSGRRDLGPGKGSRKHET